MNEERLLELADYVEGLDHEVDLMATTRIPLAKPRAFHMDVCPQCLIGQTGVLFSSLVPESHRFWTSDDATEVLGLDTLDGNLLFFPTAYYRKPGTVLERITPKIAAETLRHLAATGEVEWPVYETIDSILSDSQHDFDFS